MKQKVFAVISVCLMVLFVAFLPQDKQKAKQMDQQKQMQMLEMMQDSALVNMLMDHMAADKGMRMKMMHKIMHHGKADSAGRNASRRVADPAYYFFRRDTGRFQIFLRSSNCTTISTR